MKKFKSLIRWTIGLGVLSIVGGIFSHLALTDISHGEADATLEWTILRISAVIFAAFVVLSLLVLGRVLKQTKDGISL